MYFSGHLKLDWTETPSPVLWGIITDLLTSMGLTDLSEF